MKPPVTTPTVVASGRSSIGAWSGHPWGKPAPRLKTRKRNKPATGSVLRKRRPHLQAEPWRAGFVIGHNPRLCTLL